LWSSITECAIGGIDATKGEPWTLEVGAVRCLPTLLTEVVIFR
jgi:hypothetical protein